MTYELKDKINLTPELLADLEMKGWQEIEHLQAQIANLAEGPATAKLRQLLNNLLTSYYVFTGGIEALESDPLQVEAPATLDSIEEPDADITPEIIDTETIIEPIDDFSTEVPDNYEVSEPFEYFVEFDDPIGEPLSDKDLYGN